jgi:hypothetical protein
VKTTVDAQLLREARRFALRFACDDCAHFDPDHERCSLRFVAAPRRSALASDDESFSDDASSAAGHDPGRPGLQSPAIADAQGRAAQVVELCKAFELT